MSLRMRLFYASLYLPFGDAGLRRCPECRCTLPAGEMRFHVLDEEEVARGS